MGQKYHGIVNEKLIVVLDVQPCKYSKIELHTLNG